MKLIDFEVALFGHASPVAYYHAHWTRATSPLLDELGAVLDHITAHTREGPCSSENLATACNKCNGRKNSASVDEWGMRPIRKPIKGKYGEPEAWDGMSSLFIALAERHASKLNSTDRDWLRALKKQSDVRVPDNSTTIEVPPGRD